MIASVHYNFIVLKHYRRFFYEKENYFFIFSGNASIFF